MADVLWQRGHYAQALEHVDSDLSRVDATTTVRVSCRTHQIDGLVGDLLGGQNVVIISPRRYGKSSLAQRAHELLRDKKVLVAYADLFRATTKQRLVDELGTALYRGLAGPLGRARAVTL